MNFRDDPDNHRYVVEVDGEIAGFSQYRRRDGRYVFEHTEVGDAYEGQGVGSGLAQFGLDDVRSKGEKMVPLCPFIAAYIDRHPHYADLVDHELFARIADD